MYHHVKKLMDTVNIGEPDVRFGIMLLEQFGGANSPQRCSTPFRGGTV
jgi:Mn-containing catalase